MPPSSSYLITHKISDTKKTRFYCIHLVRLETIPIKIRIKEIPLFFRLFATVISARQPETTWFSLSAEITYTLHSKERHTCLYSVRSHIFYVPVTPKMPVSQHKRHQFFCKSFCKTFNCDCIKYMIVSYGQSMNCRTVLIRLRYTWCISMLSGR